MFYRYHQSTGLLGLIINDRYTGSLTSTEEILETGYSGGNIPPHHEPKAINNFDFQSTPMYGPIPCGIYKIETPIDHTKLGSCALPLSPRNENEMFGRGGFFIHGDSLTHPGQASEGCIIVSVKTRLYIARHLSMIDLLEVVK